MTLNIRIIQDGNQYMCVESDFEDLVNSPSWWGDTADEALFKYKVCQLIGEDEPKVRQRKGVYLPYQPQVEQHKRTGRNLLRAQIRKRLEAK